jgi:hypothetical protein
MVPVLSPKRSLNPSGSLEGREKKGEEGRRGEGEKGEEGRRGGEKGEGEKGRRADEEKSKCVHIGGEVCKVFSRVCEFSLAQDIGH